MAQLRNGMRALTLDPRTPGETVTKLNLLLDELYRRTVRDARVPRRRPRDARRDACSRPATCRRSSSRPTARPRSSRAAAGCRSASIPDASYTEWHTTSSSRARSSCSTRTASSSVATGRSTKGSTCSLDAAAAGAARSRRASSTRCVERAARRQARAATTWRCSRSRSTGAPLGPLASSCPPTPSRSQSSARSSRTWLEQCRGARRSTRATSCSRPGRRAPTRSSTRERRRRRHRSEVEAMLTGDRVRVEVADTGDWKEPRARDEPRARAAADRGADDDGRRRAPARTARASSWSAPLTRERPGTGGTTCRADILTTRTGVRSSRAGGRARQARGRRRLARARSSLVAPPASSSIDLDGVSFIDSAGLHALFGARARRRPRAAAASRSSCRSTSRSRA